jgi:hypothetical protein
MFRSGIPTTRSIDPWPLDRAAMRQDRGRRQQESIQAAEAVENGHDAFAEPLVGNPGPAAKREAERVGIDQLVSREHPAADDGVPESTRIAK